MDGKSEYFKKIQTAFKKDKMFKDIPAFVLPNIEQGLQNNQELLESDKYKSTVSEYERTKKKLSKNPYWYSLHDGPLKIEKLAENLGFNAYYEMLYRTLSTSTHGNAIIQGKIARNNDRGIDVFQIRLASGAKNVTVFTINLTSFLFKTYVLKRVPNKKAEFDAWIQSILPIFKELES
jgi:hypothetical protein